MRRDNDKLFLDHGAPVRLKYLEGLSTVQLNAVEL
jgi:hypothetical protein